MLMHKEENTLTSLVKQTYNTYRKKLESKIIWVVNHILCTPFQGMPTYIWAHNNHITLHNIKSSEQIK
jgi:hypothetical protein